MKKKKIANSRNNLAFIDSAMMNDDTYFNYLDRFKKLHYPFLNG